MTRQPTHLTLTILCISLCGHMAAGFQKASPPDSGDQFNLSEPEVDDSVRPSPEPAKPTPSTTAESRRSRTAPGDEPQGDAGVPESRRSEDDTKRKRESSPTAARRQASRASSTRDPDFPKTELKEFDPPAEPFFSAAIPRTAAIANDASLNDVCNVGPLTWAVGERGVICFSEDAGTTWTTRITPFECSLKSVCFLTNTIGWVAGHRTQPGALSQQSAVLLQTRDGGRSWTDLTDHTGHATVGLSAVPATMLPGIIHIQYFGLESAIAVTAPMRRQNGHAVFRSEDGGRTWSPIPSDQTGGPWLGAEFRSESDGIVVGQHQSYAAVVADQAVVINRPEPTLRAIRSVSLDTSACGWIAGDGGFLLTTNDAGVTWRPPAGQIPREVTEFVDFHVVAHQDSTILLGGNPGASLLHSADNGESWRLVPLPLTGRLNRLHFLNQTDVIGVGSLGQIVRSSDRGQTWQAVRSSGFRTGVLNLMTDADKAAWHLLSNVSAEQGIRSVAIQVSQPLSLAGNALRDGVPMSDNCTAAVTQLGGNDTDSHWMFPRTKPEHHRSSEQLVAEWNRQTDGRLRELLPLRIARDIRNWRPSVIVIETASDDDAIAAILRDVMPLAVSLAADDQSEGIRLSPLGLSPWKVDRVLGRVPESQAATLTFRDSDLLPSLGTTSGLLHNAVRKLFARPVTAAPSDAKAGYELLSDANGQASIANLFDGIDNRLKADARRPSDLRSRAQIEILKQTLQTSRIESTALNGQMQSGETEDALIAQLYGIGASLPATLALGQLQDLADINLQQNNMEGYLAVQQEILRRYPALDEAQTAAEMLFLFYSSAEARHYRLGAAQARTATQQAADTALRRTPNDAVETVAASLSVQPKVQAPAASPFASGASNPLEALHQRWDSQAMTAFSILSNAGRGNRSVASTPLVQLRIAANYRLQQKSGEHTTILSELSQRDDQYGVFARCEIQTTHMPAAPVLPLINLPKRSERPFLDGVLTDSIWEDAEEILLTRFVRDSPDPVTGTRRKSFSDEADVSSLTMLAWDDEFLYLAARLQRAPEKSQPVELALHRGYDAKHENRDRLELEIDTDRDFGTAFQLTVDESGKTSDRCWMLDKWNPKWFVAVDADADAWRIEAAIPLKELSATGAKPGDLWNIRLRRIIPGVLQHELQTGTNPVATDGTGMVRFIRPRRTTASSQR
jgi:photosystem II stability/assembly factor-like uncharacterized protein